MPRVSMTVPGSSPRLAAGDQSTSSHATPTKQVTARVSDKVYTPHAEKATTASTQSAKQAATPDRKRSKDKGKQTVQPAVDSPVSPPPASRKPLVAPHTPTSGGSIKSANGDKDKSPRAPTLSSSSSSFNSPAASSSGSPSSSPVLTDKSCSAWVRAGVSIVDALKKAKVKSTLVDGMIDNAVELEKEISDTVLAVAVSGATGVGKTTLLNAIATQPDDAAVMASIQRMVATRSADGRWHAEDARLLTQLPLPQGRDGLHVTQCSTSLVVVADSQPPHIKVRTNKQPGQYPCVWSAVSALFQAELKSAQRSRAKQPNPSSPFQCPCLRKAGADQLTTALRDAAEWWVEYVLWYTAFCTAYKLQQMTERARIHLQHLLIFHSVSRASLDTLRLARSKQQQQQQQQQQQPTTCSSSAQQPVTAMVDEDEDDDDDEEKEKVLDLEYGYMWQFPSTYCLRDTPGFSNDSAEVDASRGSVGQWYYQHSHAIIMVANRAVQYGELSNVLRFGGFQDFNRTPVLGIVWPGDCTAAEQMRYLSNDPKFDKAATIKAGVQIAVKKLQENLDILPAEEGQWQKRSNHISALYANCVLMPFVSPHECRDGFSVAPYTGMLQALRQHYMSSIMVNMVKYVHTSAVLSRQLASGQSLVVKNKHNNTFKLAAKEQKRNIPRRLDVLHAQFKKDLNDVLDMEVLVDHQNADDCSSSDDDSSDDSSDDSYSGSGSDFDSGSSSDGMSKSDSAVDSGSDLDYDTSRIPADTGSSTRKPANSRPRKRALCRRPAQVQIDDTRWDPFVKTVLSLLRDYIGKIKERCYDVSLSRTYEFYAENFDDDKRTKQSATTSSQPPHASSSAASSAATTTVAVSKADKKSSSSAVSSSGASSGSHASSSSRSPADGNGKKAESQTSKEIVEELLNSSAEMSRMGEVVSTERVRAERELFTSKERFRAQCRECIEGVLDTQSGSGKRRAIKARTVLPRVKAALCEMLLQKYLDKWERKFQELYTTTVSASQDELYAVLSANDGKAPMKQTWDKANDLANALKHVIKAHLKQTMKPDSEEASKRRAQDPELPSNQPKIETMAAECDTLLYHKWTAGKSNPMEPHPCYFDGEVPISTQSAAPPAASSSASASNRSLQSALVSSHSHHLAHIRCEYGAGPDHSPYLVLHMAASVKQQIEKFKEVINVRAWDFHHGKKFIDCIFPMITPVFLPEGTAEDDEDELERIVTLLTKEDFDSVTHLHFLLCQPRQMGQLQALFAKAGRAAEVAGDGEKKAFQQIRSSKVLVELPSNSLDPLCVLDIGKHIVTKFGFPFSWRMSQAVGAHCEVDVLATKDCSRARLFVLMQHTVVRFFVYIRGELQRLLSGVAPMTTLVGICASLLAETDKSKKMSLEQFNEINKTLLMVTDVEAKPYNESQLQPLQALLDRLLPATSAQSHTQHAQTRTAGKKGEKEQQVNDKAVAVVPASAAVKQDDGSNPYSLPAAFLDDLKRVRNLLGIWSGVATYSAYLSEKVRSRFLARYPNFHLAVKQSAENRSLVLDHISAQRHTWFASQKEHEPHVAQSDPDTDPYASFNNFYNAIYWAEIKFARKFSNNKRLSITMFLGSFAFKNAKSFDVVPKEKRRRRKTKNGDDTEQPNKTIKARRPRKNNKNNKGKQHSSSDMQLDFVDKNTSTALVVVASTSSSSPAPTTASRKKRVRSVDEQAGAESSKQTKKAK